MDMIQISIRKSFTLIELMIAMVLMGMLALLLIGNFNTTLKKGRDSQRKNDLSQLQKALELYYEDNRSYPKFDIITNPIKKFCTTEACDTAKEVVYMIKTSNDPGASYVYNYSPQPTPIGGGSSSYYYLYSYIENSQDQGSGVSQNGFTTNKKCDAAKITTNCRYYVGSSNAPQLTPNP